MKLSDSVLKKRVFKQNILDLHLKDFMIGQTTPYLNKFKDTLDIGAATGMYASHFAQHSKSVICFEAVYPVYQQLEKLKQKHGNIITHNFAVSDFEGISDFYVDDKRLSNSSFQNLVEGQKIEVETITIDGMKLDNVGFMKIDVEGVELDVLNGASQTIDKFKPTCMVEIYEKFNKYPVETTFDFFFNRGYRCFYNHKGQGLKPVRNIEEGLEATKIPEITDGDFLFTI
jgi:FkbM family methyltransferase|tara:strand:+ start:5903 stop:6589 length:687 start_codon:yes stop_codon:yes gene_type:complete